MKTIFIKIRETHMKLKTLTLLCALGLAALGTSAEAKEKLPAPVAKAQAPAAPTLDPSNLLPMLCSAITAMANIPEGCRTACANPTAPQWNDLSCCLKAV